MAGVSSVPAHRTAVRAGMRRVTDELMESLYFLRPHAGHLLGIGYRSAKFIDISTQFAHGGRVDAKGKAETL